MIPIFGPIHWSGLLFKGGLNLGKCFLENRVNGNVVSSI